RREPRPAPPARPAPPPPPPPPPPLHHPPAGGENTRGSPPPHPPRRLHVDDQFELLRLLHRQVSWLFAIHDAYNVACDTAVHFREVGAVSHQSARVDK